MALIDFIMFLWCQPFSLWLHWQFQWPQVHIGATGDQYSARSDLIQCCRVLAERFASFLKSSSDSDQLGLRPDGNIGHSTRTISVPGPDIRFRLSF